MKKGLLKYLLLQTLLKQSCNTEFPAGNLLDNLTQGKFFPTL